MELTMRNTQTGEVTTVDEGSAKFEEMRLSRRHVDDKPLWEQVSRPQAVAQQKRIAAGQGTYADVPDGGQPTRRLGFGVRTDGVNFGPDFSEPSPGEISQGAGRAHEDANPEDSKDVSNAAIGKDDIAAAIDGPDGLAGARGQGGSGLAGGGATTTLEHEQDDAPADKSYSSKDGKEVLQSKVDELELNEFVVGTGKDDTITKADLKDVLDRYDDGEIESPADDGSDEKEKDPGDDGDSAGDDNSGAGDAS